MKKPYVQHIVLSTLYKGVCQWVLKLIVGVGFSNSSFLKNEQQFIIVANHNSHLDTLSILASLPGSLIWKVKPVAAEDYFGKTKIRKAFSNFFINTLLISRDVKNIDAENHPIEKMLKCIDAGYSLILFPEGTRGTSEQMNSIKPGIAKILSLRPHVKYVPVFLTGMGRSLSKGNVVPLPYKSSVNYGKPTNVKSTNIREILAQIIADFEEMQTMYQPVVPDEED